jgi:hypothetical protein
MGEFSHRGWKVGNSCAVFQYSLCNYGCMYKSLSVRVVLSYFFMALPLIT